MRDWLSLMCEGMVEERGCGLVESRRLGLDWMRTSCPNDQVYATMFGCRNLQVELIIKILDTNT